MATHAFVNVDLAEAAALADLNGVAIDLESVRRLSKCLADFFASGKVDMDVVDAFSTAILICYSRPFMFGVRERIGGDILAALTARQRKLHEQFMEWRNKHIAHSVNPFEDNQVVAYYNDEKVSAEGLQSISVQQNRLIGLGTQDLNTIQELSEALLKHVNSRIDAEKTNILGIIRSMPIKEVMSKGVKAPCAPGMESVNVVRKKKNRKGAA